MKAILPFDLFSAEKAEIIQGLEQNELAGLIHTHITSSGTATDKKGLPFNAVSIEIETDVTMIVDNKDFLQHGIDTIDGV